MIERIRKIIQYYNLSISSFASKIGTNQVTLNQQINGDRKISLDTVTKILDSFENISPEWLLKGEGPMWKENFSPAPAREKTPSGLKTGFAGENPDGCKNTNNCFYKMLEEKDLQIARFQKEIAKFQEQHDRLITVIENLTKKK